MFIKIIQYQVKVIRLYNISIIKELYRLYLKGLLRLISYEFGAKFKQTQITVSLEKKKNLLNKTKIKMNITNFHYIKLPIQHKKHSTIKKSPRKHTNSSNRDGINFSNSFFKKSTKVQKKLNFYKSQ